MSAALGIGVRVYMGWTPDSHAEPSTRGARCSTGLIIGGPFVPEERPTHAFVSWDVHPDHLTMIVCVDEHLLFPIDDDGEAVMTDERLAVVA